MEYDITKLESLFSEAKEADEFEFCCTLLHIRGMEDAGWDSLEESYKLITQTMSVIASPLSGDFKIRLMMLVYCHITEMDDLYNIITNLLWIISGKRYSMNPFYYENFPDRKTIRSPESKVERISEIADITGDSFFKEIFKEMICKQVRNAFFHSDYAIYRDEFRIINGEGVTINAINSKKTPLEWLIKKIELTANFILQMLAIIDKHRFSYTGNKEVTGRILNGDELAPITLLANEKGLYGFRSS